MNDLYILNEIHDGVTTGMASLEDLYKKSTDSNFKEYLASHYNTYLDTLDTLNREFEKKGKIPKDPKMSKKAMMWAGIELNTIKDTSNSKLSEILIQGYDMGIIKGTKLLNQNPDASPTVKNIVKSFITTQKNNINDLKKFL